MDPGNESAPGSVRIRAFDNERLFRERLLVGCSRKYLAWADPAFGLRGSHRKLVEITRAAEISQATRQPGRAFGPEPRCRRQSNPVSTNPKYEFWSTVVGSWLDNEANR
jgi:hypothetical protein